MDEKNLKSKETPNSPNRKRRMLVAATSALSVEFLLARPISRIQFLLSFAFAFILLAVLLGTAVG